MASYTPTFTTGAASAPSYNPSLNVSISACGNYTNQNFYGFLLGDVNWDWNTSTQSITNIGSIALTLNHEVASNNTVKVPLKVANFKNLMGMQFTLSFDTTVLDWDGVKSNSLGFLYNDANSEHGVVSFIWNDSTLKGTTLKDSTIILELGFKKKGAISDSSINITSDLTPIEVFDINFNRLGIQNLSSNNGGYSYNKINEEVISSTSSASLLNISPNPCKGNINLNIVSILNKQIKVQLYDAVGKLVLQDSKSLSIGSNTISMNLNNIKHLTKGSYFIKVVGLEKDLIKSIVIVD